MDVRFIGLKDPIERSVFEIYAALALDTFAVERPGALTEEVRSTLRVYVTALLACDGQWNYGCERTPAAVVGTRSNLVSLLAADLAAVAVFRRAGG